MSLLIYRASHRLEKYLNIEGVLKIKSALKSTQKILLKGLEKFLKFTSFAGLSTVNEDLNRYKIVMLLFGAVYAAPNKAITILF